MRLLLQLLANGTRGISPAVMTDFDAIQLMMIPSTCPTLKSSTILVKEDIFDPQKKGQIASLIQQYGRRTNTIGSYGWRYDIFFRLPDVYQNLSVEGQAICWRRIFAVGEQNFLPHFAISQIIDETQICCKVIESSSLIPVI